MISLPKRKADSTVLILESMKDSELRGIVLKFLYERRREDGLLFGEVQGATDIPASLAMKIAPKSA
jgi:hypothetical protein